MEQFTLVMEKINQYIQHPFGMLTVCTAPIVAYYAVQLFIKPALSKKDKQNQEKQ